MFCGHSVAGAVAHRVNLAVHAKLDASKRAQSVSVAFGAPHIGPVEVSWYIEARDLRGNFLTIVNHRDPLFDMLTLSERLQRFAPEVSIGCRNWVSNIFWKPGRNCWSSNRCRRSLGWWWGGGLKSFPL